MPKEIESKYAICPYYRKEINSRVYCESIIADAYTCHSFPDMEKCIAYKRRYCYSHKYTECSHAKALEEKYEQIRK